MTVRVKLGAEPRAHTGEVLAPLATDGNPLRWEWIDEARGERVYVASADELLGEWLPGYDQADAEQRLTARIEHAAAVRAEVAAAVVARVEAEGAVIDPDDRLVLLDSSWSPPQVRSWSNPVALVLIDVFYAPFTNRPAPTSGLDGDVAEPRNLLWLRPSAADDYVRSLAHAGFASLAERTA